MPNDSDSINKDEGHSNKSSDIKALLWLILISFLVAFSPAIYALILIALVKIGVTTMPGGAGALPFLMFFTMPAGGAVFIIGLIIMIVRTKTT